MTTYKTGQIARLAKIHPNTVRFYEQIGFLTPPKRLSNGYRMYNELHLKQIGLIRLAMRAEVLQGGVRDKAVEMLRCCAALDIDGAVLCAMQYCAMLENESARAKAAISWVESRLASFDEESGELLRRGEAAAQLDVTTDTLRNWERNGLITVKRRQNGYRVYSKSDMQRLNMIRTLRGAGYSLTAVLRLLRRLDRGLPFQVGHTLDTPCENEDIVTACDRLLTSLKNAASDAKKFVLMLEEIKICKKTLQ